MNIWEFSFDFRVSFICEALRDLVAFVQFKKREKHLWRSVNFSKVAGCITFGKTEENVYSQIVPITFIVWA